MPKSKQQRGGKPGRHQQHQQHRHRHHRVPAQPPLLLPQEEEFEVQSSNDCKSANNEEVRQFVGEKLDRLLLDSEFFSTGLSNADLQCNLRREDQHLKVALGPDPSLLGAAFACLPIEIRLPDSLEFVDAAEQARQRQLAMEATLKYARLVGLEGESAMSMWNSILAAAAAADSTEVGDIDAEFDEAEQFDWLDLAEEEEEEEKEEEEEEKEEKEEEKEEEEEEEEEEKEEAENAQPAAVPSPIAEIADPLCCNIDVADAAASASFVVGVDRANEKSLDDLEAELFDILG